MMRPVVRTLFLFLLFALVSGCSSLQSGAGGNWAGHTETGQASFYSDRHQNQKTASGELYKADQATAAHRTLPFGSRVRVTNTRNGKSVVVRINDRGPFVRGRIIDLSRSAFSSIGATSAGLLDVKIEVLR
jgi:rare lipoprotein A|tara:strand:- start:287 stop:679 length:393 start_codon:yes stop_codon:yes gene_type:complete